MKLISKVFFVVSIALFAFFAISNPVYLKAQISETSIQKESRLQAELAQVEKEQAETEAILKSAQNQSASLKRDILILDTKIKVALLNIKAKNLLIESLGKDIVKKQDKIESLEQRIDRGRETLAQIMRKTNEVDSYSLPEFILSQDNLSIMFSDLDTFESVQQSMKLTFEQIRNDKSETESEKNALDKRKNNEIDARAVIQSEKKNIENDEAEKQRLLTVSKGNEKTYSQVLNDKKVKAAQIRAALFALRDAESIPFEKALQYANAAAKATGIRPAFLLAILTQESSLGKNVGSCYLTNANTGEGISVKSGKLFTNVMKPGRDVEPFINITKSLGMDYTKTLVSCPQSVGWGGAMGPAQFIASTWMLFKDRISNALGGAIPNPWAPQDAFMASSMYLTDLGAYAGSYTGERNAACRYYSGKSCGGNSVNSTYGNQVMAKADNIQRTMIDPLQGL
jgi:membrane-bound lytic murein transglycosylase B